MTDAIDAVEECMLCRPEIADVVFTRVRLWEDQYWRLSAVLQGAIPGFAHLETRRHIPFITDLDGPEAATLGPVLARATRVLREAAGAELTYVYVFGERTPHLHFNLAPHRDGDGLRGGPGLPTPMCRTPIPPCTGRWPTQPPEPWPMPRLGRARQPRAVPADDRPAGHRTGLRPGLQSGSGQGCRGVRSPAARGCRLP